MIRALLFDIGNVIVRFDFTRAVQAVAAKSQVSDFQAALGALEPAKIAYEDGKLSRQDFLHRAFETLAFAGTESEFIAAWQGIFWANEPMHVLIRQLHGHYPLYLLSNTNCMHVEGLFRDYDLFRLFKGAIYSHEAGCSKPHPEIFQKVVHNLGLVPAETFFIDDLAPNIATAKEQGFPTHHYHHGQHQALLDDLQKAGVLPLKTAP